MASCDRCGGYVSADYVRVFGDNQNRIDSCPDCPVGRAEEGSDASEEPRGLTFRMSEYESDEERDRETTGPTSFEDDPGRLGRVSAAVSGLF